MPRVLITGATRGLGREVAGLFVEEGWQVVLTGRKVAALLEVQRVLDPAGDQTLVVPMDVTDANSISEAAQAVERSGLGSPPAGLDVLVHNAGVYPREADRLTQPGVLDGMRLAWETNTAAVVAVTKCFLPQLGRSDNPRVVAVSSGLGSFGWCADPEGELYGSGSLAYQVSKAALNMVVVCLAKELAAQRVAVNAVSPGWCRTDMGGEAAPRSAMDGAATIRRACEAVWPETGKFFGSEGMVPW